MASVNGFIKYSMFIFNFTFWVCGCVILGTSIYARVSKHGQEIIRGEAAGLDIYLSINLLIAVGTIIMILGFLGCCGTMKESRCMLLLFFIGLLLILLIQIAAGIVGVAFRSKLENSFRKTFQEEVKILSQNEPKNEAFQKNLDQIQKKFKCCGLVNGAADWGTNFSKYSTSCECGIPTNNTCVEYMGKKVYNETCGEYVIKFLRKNLVIIAGIAFGVAVIEEVLLSKKSPEPSSDFEVKNNQTIKSSQVLGLVFSMVLYHQIGKK